MARKGLRAGDSVNAAIAILLVFAALGALDECLGGRLGVAQEFRRGLGAMGSLCLSTLGIYSVVLSALADTSVQPGTGALPFDAALPVGFFLASDMGGWALSQALASTPQLAAYAGLLVASTLGCLISFVLPASLGTLQSHEVMGFMQGVLWGVVALPAGLLLGGVLLGLAPLSLLQNWWPVALLCVVLCLALRFVPRACMRALAFVGGAVRVAGIGLFCVVMLGLFVPALAVAGLACVSEALVIVAKVAVVMGGSMVASGLALAKCGRWLAKLAARLGVNEYAVLGLAASLVSSISMLPLYPRMDVRGKVMNAAFTVAGAFVLGGQMAFVSSVADGRAVAAYFVAKLSAGALAVWLAARFTRNVPQENAEK